MTVLAFDSPLRRHGRALRRIIAATATPALRHGHTVRTFWWDGHPNFGDAMTPWLLPRYGILPLYAAPRAAHLAGVGSVLDLLPPDYAGAV